MATEEDWAAFFARARQQRADAIQARQRLSTEVVVPRLVAHMTIKIKAVIAHYIEHPRDEINGTYTFTFYELQEVFYAPREDYESITREEVRAAAEAFAKTDAGKHIKCECVEKDKALAIVMSWPW